MLLLQCYAITDKKVIHNVDEFFFERENSNSRCVGAHRFSRHFYKTIKKYLMVNRI